MRPGGRRKGAAGQEALDAPQEGIEGRPCMALAEVDGCEAANGSGPGGRRGRAQWWKEKKGGTLGRPQGPAYFAEGWRGCVGKESTAMPM